MYQHRVWEDQLVYHELRGANSWLKLVPARGGIITEWVLAGKPVLYMDPTTLLDTTKNVRGGMPILFPVCGPLRD